MYSIFSKRNQISLFSCKAYDKLIVKMTGSKGGVPMLIGGLSIAIFQLTELNIKVNTPCFEGTLNDTINYAQKGCMMQM